MTDFDKVRPKHPDFWALSEVLVAHDAEMDQGGNFEDAVGRYIHMPSLVYAGTQQAGMAVQRLGKLVWGAREVQTALASGFVSAFIVGMKYQIKKDVDHQAAQFPWVVDHFKPGLLPGEQGELVARFTSQEDAEAFIEIIQRRDPEGVERGDYGVTGPSEDN